MLKPKFMSLKYRNKLKQYFFRLKFKKIENIRLLLKIIMNTSYIEKQAKVLSVFFLININVSSSLSKHKNICLSSSWKRSVQPFLKLNRLSFLENTEKLLIPGIINTKW